MSSRGSKRTGLIIWGVIGIIGGLLFIIGGGTILAIQEEQINIPIYPPPNQTTHFIEPDIWIEYSWEPREESDKPWYFLATNTLFLTEDQDTWYVYASRPFWWWPIPGGYREGNFYILTWGKNLWLGSLVLLVGIIDLFAWGWILIVVVMAEIDVQVLALIKERIPRRRHKTVIEWVSRFPNTSGQIAIANFLANAQGAGRLAFAIKVLEKYWESDFKSQAPKIRGDSEALPNVKRLLTAMYQEAEVPLPETKS